MAPRAQFEIIEETAIKKKREREGNSIISKIEINFLYVSCGPLSTSCLVHFSLRFSNFTFGDFFSFTLLPLLPLLLLLFSLFLLLLLLSPPDKEGSALNKTFFFSIT